MIELILCIILALGWGVTGFLFWRYAKKKDRSLTVEAQDLLADLFNSNAIVRIEVLDPKNLLYRRE